MGGELRVVFDILGPQKTCAGNVVAADCFLRPPTSRPPHAALPFSRGQLTIDYFQRRRGTKRMVDMFFEFTELCTTIPPLEYGGNEVLLDYFAAKVRWPSFKCDSLLAECVISVRQVSLTKPCEDHLPPRQL